MTQQGFLAIHLDCMRVFEDLDPGLIGKLPANHEVAIAVHEIDRDTAVGKFAYRRLNNPIVGIWVVVAYPGFEQVTENVQGLGLGSVCLQEPNELITDLGPLSLEMQIGNKQRCHCCYSNV